MKDSKTKEPKLQGIELSSGPQRSESSKKTQKEK